MSSLELRLIELGATLDAPVGDGLVERVADDLAAAVPHRRRRRDPRRVVALVAAGALLVGLAVVEPARNAIADLFRSGRVELRSTHAFRTTPPSHLHRTPPAETHTTPLSGAQAAVAFPIRLPRLVPSQSPTISVDRRVPGGLVSLEYQDFRVVEIAAGPGPSVMAKAIDPKTRMAAVTVGGAPGLWITGTHHLIAYLDRDGNVRQDTVREAGHVLLWATGGVTFRVEGFHQLAAARQIADAIS